MLIIENEWLKVGIVKSGAEIREVQHKQTGLDYMWTGDSTYWGRVSPVLFPIVGRLKNDQYQLDGKIYKMSQHGFLRDVEFEVAEQTASSISFVVESAGKFLEVYPYEFKVMIRYLLEAESLNVEWEVVNEDSSEIYFSIGAHPAFRIPLLENETLADYRLHFTPADKKEVMEYEIKDSLVQEKGSVTDLSSIELAPSLFKNDALIYSDIEQITLESEKSSHGVEVMFKDFPFVGVWSKYSEQDDAIAPFVCIEPWHGIADTVDTTGNFKEKFGVNRLEAGEIFQAAYTMKFK